VLPYIKNNTIDRWWQGQT